MITDTHSDYTILLIEAVHMAYIQRFTRTHTLYRDFIGLSENINIYIYMFFFSSTAKGLHWTKFGSISKLYVHCEVNVIIYI